jgi:hypothetical protein
VAAGFALNMAAVIPNRGMPVSVAALRQVGGSERAFVVLPNLDKHVASHGNLVARVLGDVVPIPVLGAVISAGDVVILVGVVMVLAFGMATRAHLIGPRGSHVPADELTWR